MNDENLLPELTPEQEHALDSCHGIVQGSNYVIMRNEKVLDWFGFSEQELREKLNLSIDQASRDEFVDWDTEHVKATARKRANHCDQLDG